MCNNIEHQQVSIGVLDAQRLVHGCTFFQNVCILVCLHHMLYVAWYVSTNWLTSIKRRTQTNLVWQPLVIDSSSSINRILIFLNFQIGVKLTKCHFLRWTQISHRNIFHGLTPKRHGDPTESLECLETLKLWQS